MAREEQKSEIECCIVLHTTKFGEGKMVVHTLTHSHSRKSYITRLGGKKGEARRLLGPLSIVEFNAKYGSGDLGKMTNIVACPALYSINENIVKCTLALFMSELLYRVARNEGENDGDLFDFTKNSILCLEAMENKRSIANFHLYFMVHLASHLGYAPRANWAEGMWFDIKMGEFTSYEPQHSLILAPHSARILSLLIESKDGQTENVELNRTERSHFLSSMVDYYAWHTDSIHSVRSIAILSEIF